MDSLVRGSYSYIGKSSRALPQTNPRCERYEEKLRNAGLTSLRERRKIVDAIEAFKTLGGFNNVNKHSWFDIADDSARSTRSTSSVSDQGEEERKTNILKGKNVRLETRKNFYTVRVVKEWNVLPENVRKQPNVNSFKNPYDEWANSTKTR